MKSAQSSEGIPGDHASSAQGGAPPPSDPPDGGKGTRRGGKGGNSGESRKQNEYYAAQFEAIDQLSDQIAQIAEIIGEVHEWFDAFRSKQNDPANMRVAALLTICKAERAQFFAWKRQLNTTYDMELHDRIIGRSKLPRMAFESADLRHQMRDLFENYDGPPSTTSTGESPEDDGACKDSKGKGPKNPSPEKHVSAATPAVAEAPVVLTEAAAREEIESKPPDKPPKPPLPEPVREQVRQLTNASGWTVSYRKYYSECKVTAQKLAASQGFPNAEVVVAPVKEDLLPKIKRWGWRAGFGAGGLYLAYVAATAAARLYERWWFANKIMAHPLTKAFVAIGADALTQIITKESPAIASSLAVPLIKAAASWVGEVVPLVTYPSFSVLALAGMVGCIYPEWYYRTHKSVAVVECRSTMTKLLTADQLADERTDHMATTSLKHSDPVAAEFTASNKWIGDYTCETAVLNHVGEFVASCEVVAQVVTTGVVRLPAASLYTAVSQSVSTQLSVNIPRGLVMSDTPGKRSMMLGSAMLAYDLIVEAKSRAFGSSASSFQ